MNNEQKDHSLPSASLVQNGLLAEAKLRPILFSTDMVTAILEGRKTMTRRKFKPKDEPYLINEKSFINYSDSFGWNVKHEIGHNPERFEITQQFKCPYGGIGDVLWVREKWRHNETQTGFPYHYYEDDTIYTDRDNEKWKPSLFMPKQACRLFLEVTDIKIEKLNTISPEDAEREGIEHLGGDIWKDYMNKKCFPEFMQGSTFTRTSSFKSLWEKINGVKSWEANPYVWVITFKVVECPQGFR